MIDWQRVVLNIRSAGMSVTATAKRIQMAPETLMHYARGESKDPPFSKALALLDLHHALCPDRHKIEDLRK